MKILGLANFLDFFRKFSTCNQKFYIKNSRKYLAITIFFHANRQISVRSLQKHTFFPQPKILVCEKILVEKVPQKFPKNPPKVPQKSPKSSPKIPPKFPMSVIFVCFFRDQFAAPSIFVHISQPEKEYLKFII